MTDSMPPTVSASSTFELEEEEFDEALGLLDHPVMDHEETPQEQANSNRAWRWWIVTMCLVTGFSAFLSHVEKTHDSYLYPNFQCPAEGKLPEKVGQFEELREKEYEEVSKKLSNNMTEFVKEFRQSAFNDWGETYADVEAKIHDWKVKHYVPYMKNGSSIFESACGIGLNLYLTLEILNEEAGIQNVVVYGNDYVQASADQANVIFDQIPPANAKKGRICTGDSTDLSYIPSESFDLVFTGYLSTLLDPLKFALGDVHETFNQYIQLCESDTEDWQGQKLIQIAQQRQQDWYGLWVGEMARIAKPGAPIIVESISPPFCEDTKEWGGVSKDWWKEVAQSEKYGWGVDPESLDYGQDYAFDDRYHVFMRKKEDGKEDGE